ncbi:hypothetical protein [Streptomyces sp. NPDC001880]
MGRGRRRAEPDPPPDRPLPKTDRQLRAASRGRRRRGGGYRPRAGERVAVVLCGANTYPGDPAHPTAEG